MINLREFITTNIINGIKNGTFSKEYGNIMAVNYLAKGLLLEEDVATVDAEITAWEEAKETVTEEITEPEETVEEIPETEEVVEETTEETPVEETGEETTE